MINRDYILRLAEQFGSELAIIIGIKKRNRYDEAFAYIDEFLFRTVGLTSRFINSLPDETLVKTLSPLGKINVEPGLWIAGMLKAEGLLYEEQGNDRESYYRYQKSLYVYLTVLKQEPIEFDSFFAAEVQELLQMLADYELPDSIQYKLFFYYEQAGNYATAEDMLFHLLDQPVVDAALPAQGIEFYTRLLKKHDTDLEAGNLSHAEVEEGLAQLRQKTSIFD